MLRHRVWDPTALAAMEARAQTGRDVIEEALAETIPGVEENLGPVPVDMAHLAAPPHEYTEVTMEQHFPEMELWTAVDAPPQVDEEAAFELFIDGS